MIATASCTSSAGPVLVRPALRRGDGVAACWCLHRFELRNEDGGEDAVLTLVMERQGRWAGRVVKVAPPWVAVVCVELVRKKEGVVARVVIEKSACDEVVVLKK